MSSIKRFSLAATTTALALLSPLLPESIFLNHSIAWGQAAKSQRTTEFSSQIAVANQLIREGNILVITNQPKKALQKFKTALQLCRQENFYTGESFALYFMGQAFEKLQQHQNSIDIYRQYLEVLQSKTILAEGMVDQGFVNNTKGKILHRIGSAHIALSQYQKALTPLQQSLENRKEVGDHAGEGAVSYGLGLVYRYLGQYPKALIFSQQALTISKEVGDRAGEGKTLNNIGVVYEKLGQYETALKTYQTSLVIFRELGDRAGEGNTLDNIGIVYEKLGQYKKSLKLAQQALAIRKEVKDRIGEGTTLNNIAVIYAKISQYQKALNFYQKALNIRREVRDRQGEGATLNNMALIYNILDQSQQSLDISQQALMIRREIGDLNGEGDTLNNIANVYNSLGQYKKALDAYQAALAIFRDVGARAREGTALNNIALIYDRLGQSQDALNTYQKSLAIRKEVGDRAGEGATLNNIASVYSNLRQYQRATATYQQALAIVREIEDRAAEALTLSNIGYTLEKLKRPQLSIIFFKDSINTYETIRGDLKGLSQQQQKSYTNSISSNYRHLADLLLSNDRVLEAQQVLDLLKVQELDAYLQTVRGNNETQKSLTVLKPELTILKQFNERQSSAIQLGKELTKLRQVPAQKLTSAQQQRLTQLVQLQQKLNQDFNAFIDSSAVQTALNQLSRTAQRQTVDLADLDALRDNLKQLNAVLLYPLILEDRLELVITTPNSSPIRRTVPVKRTELNQAIVNYRRALQNPQNAQAKSLAQRLYTWLIEPIENDLKQANAKTIIYAPDGPLRYIPLAALNDGDQWLVERLRVNNITAKSFSNLNPQSQDKLSVLAGAFVKGQYQFQVGTQQFAFTGLPAAGREVSHLVDSIPGTTPFLDQDFSLAAFQPRMNAHNIVHFATHAAFVPGQPEDSFILFGNGERATLRDIGSWSLFNVDLVVLSACETGLGGQFGNGEEVLGLGYQFQNRGAKATLASLWQVDDGGTQTLMSAFYDSLKAGHISKAEALRQAQIAMITEKNSSTDNQRGSIKLVDARTQKQKKENSLNHPYYWAPFILIGNGL